VKAIEKQFSNNNLPSRPYPSTTSLAESLWQTGPPYLPILKYNAWSIALEVFFFIQYACHVFHIQKELPAPEGAHRMMNQKVNAR